ncbi:MAG: 30S ribosomal protein S4 [Pigeon pea little leaf phytoplasma]|uniref:Small ribosomal subunit protein uS4 n=1 Tax=Candidatus Phytoplasma fabacearum TaxID=2982628 RepID=A0ABU8ZRY8_9MOLU|nr:30S ribosomal protein S4 ['Bituminaria bituminosa' little leaf phytoplasma]MDV3148815.1 30S ribosomal protein S4 [Pigeon pea little leaf phytoplasma]MDO7983437.1 30S ribosomal protein S4 ['Bituminaria bituminosa' little leaf phytoplasma]MDO8023828.1 30S ribosomal protein S4 ['Bituminaria bituminosa' little leaf phytoplasma]MDO8030574.1 30S ribosomal protein S4 ['Bituminaria bituminosa' little leaf phytoplasma]MDV3153894.1 30S ribosomal protein S4 [Pigeon pea little leaf phytoplasma]
MSTAKPIWKKSRFLNFSLTGTGKELLHKKNNFNLSKNKKRKNKLSDYGLQLQEKQKVRFTYCMSEKQFKRFFINAAKFKGSHGENFLISLESRLDRIVNLLGFAKTILQARQFISHGHILVDGKKVDISSYIVKPGQKITLKEKAKQMKIVSHCLETLSKNKIDYVILDKNSLIGSYVRYPYRNEFLTDINEQLIVEYYNR